MNCRRPRVRKIVWNLCAAGLFCAAAGAQDVATALAGNSAAASRRAATIDANEAARRPELAEPGRKQGAQRPPAEQARATDAGTANPRKLRRQVKTQLVLDKAQRRAGEVARMLRAYP